MNCSKPVGSDEGKFFAGVFCCSSCSTVAQRLFERGEKELKALLLMLRESIRIALIEQRLQHEPNESVSDIPKADLLRAIVQLQEAKEQRDKNQAKR